VSPEYTPVRRSATFISLLIAVVLLGACAPARENASRYEFSRVCMGCKAVVTLYAPDETCAEAAAALAFDRLGQLDDTMSDYRRASELMRLCDRAGGPPVKVSDDLFEILGASERVSRASGGAFDITVGPAVALWRTSRRTHALPDPSALAAARSLIDWRTVELDSADRSARLGESGVRLDLGGIAKGYAAQRAVDLLKLHLNPRCLVALAGDIAAGDPPPGESGWRITVAGERSGQSVGTLLIANAAVSTSGDTEQSVEIGGHRYSHIIDPRTGLGISARRCVTVVSTRGEWADALATAACILGPEASRPMLAEFSGTGAAFDEASEAGPARRTVIDPDHKLNWCAESPH